MFVFQIKPNYLSISSNRILFKKALAAVEEDQWGRKDEQSRKVDVLSPSCQMFFIGII